MSIVLSHTGSMHRVVFHMGSRITNMPIRRTLMCFYSRALAHPLHSPALASHNLLYCCSCPQPQTLGILSHPSSTTMFGHDNGAGSSRRCRRMVGIPGLPRTLMVEEAELLAHCSVMAPSDTRLSSGWHLSVGLPGGACPHCRPACYVTSNRCLQARADAESKVESVLRAK